MKPSELTADQRRNYRRVGLAWVRRNLGALPEWKADLRRILGEGKAKGMDPAEIIRATLRQSFEEFTSMGLAVVTCSPEEYTAQEQAEAAVYHIAVQCLEDSDWDDLGKWLIRHLGPI